MPKAVAGAVRVARQQPLVLVVLSLLHQPTLCTPRGGGMQPL